jgi:hypothetical protein
MKHNLGENESCRDRCLTSTSAQIKWEHMRRKVLTVVVAINTYEEPAASIFRAEVALSNQTT